MIYIIFYMLQYFTVFIGYCIEYMLLEKPGVIKKHWGNQLERTIFVVYNLKTTFRNFARWHFWIILLDSGHAVLDHFGSFWIILSDSMLYTRLVGAAVVVN